MKQVLRVLLVALCFGVLAVACAWVGNQVAPSTQLRTDIANFDVRVLPAKQGSLHVYIPLVDWGIRSRPFHSPLLVEVEARTLDRAAVSAAVLGDNNTQALRRVKEQVKTGIHRIIVYAIIWSAVSGFTIGFLILLLSRRRSNWWIPPLLSFLSAASISAAGALASQSAQPQALDHPQYYARGAELGQLLDAADNIKGGLRSYTSGIQQGIQKYATLLSAAGSLTKVTDTRHITLLSDIHGNVQAIQAYSPVFAKDLVVVAGDISTNGSDIETQSLRSIGSLGRRTVMVSGNHDSLSMMKSFAKNAIVLTRTGRLRANGNTNKNPLVQVDSMLFAGWDDPLQDNTNYPADPNRIYSFAERKNGEQEYQKEKQRLSSWFIALKKQPDIVVIHQNGLASALADFIDKFCGTQPKNIHCTKPLLILTGHDHVQHYDIRDHSTLIDGGSAGAGGGLGIGREKLGLARLGFNHDGYSSSDLIEIDPTGGGASALRIPVGAPPCNDYRVRC